MIDDKVLIKIIAATEVDGEFANSEYIVFE
jgi:hypothetical protein